MARVNGGAARHTNHTGRSRIDNGEAAMMGSVLVTLTDADLVDLVRRGDETAFTELYARHRDVAQRMAATYCRPGEADDLADLAFEKVLGALRRGRGPTGAFRAYLFVTLRRLAAEQAERPRDRSLDELPEPVAAVAASPSLDPAEREMITTAFESLPGRWQAVLWHTAVEGRHPRDLASLLGMSANAVSALAYRAREKLRQAYLQAHLQAAPHPQCEPYRSSLGAYVRDGQSPRERRTTSAHLERCPSCQALVAELVDVNRLLARAVVPWFPLSAAPVGAALAGGVGAADAGVQAAKRSLGGWLQLHQAAAAVGGVAATTVLLMGLTQLRHLDGANPAPPGAGATVEKATPSGAPSSTEVPVVAVPASASSVTACPVKEPGPLSSASLPSATIPTSAPGPVSSVLAPAAAALSATKPSSPSSPSSLAPPSPSLTELACMPAELGDEDLKATAPGAEESEDVAGSTDGGDGGSTVDAGVEVGGQLPVDAGVTVDLGDGTRIAAEAGLPGVCGVTQDRRALTCTLETLVPGAPTEATVGLELEVPEDGAPAVTVTVSDGDQAIADQTVDLAPVTDLLPSPTRSGIGSPHRPE